MNIDQKCLAAFQQLGVPPLSQSRYGDMACQTLYVYKHVLRGATMESGPAARGIEIHRILATYIDHLVKVRRALDLEVFDQLMRSASGEAREVLERFRDNHSFDPETVLATELYIALDEDFRPIGDSWSDEGNPNTKIPSVLSTRPFIRHLLILVKQNPIGPGALTVRAFFFCILLCLPPA